MKKENENKIVNLLQEMKRECDFCNIMVSMKPIVVAVKTFEIQTIGIVVRKKAGKLSISLMGFFQEGVSLGDNPIMKETVTDFFINQKGSPSWGFEIEGDRDRYFEVIEIIIKFFNKK